MLFVERFLNPLSDPAPLLKLVDMMEGEREAFQNSFNAIAGFSDATAAAVALMRQGFTPFDHFVPEALNPIGAYQKSVLDLISRKYHADAELLRHLARPIQKVPLDLEGLSIDGEPVEAAEHPLHSTDFYNVTRIERRYPDGSPLDRVDPKVLLFVPASGHNKSLLEDTIRELAVSHEVYVFEVQDATKTPADRGPFDLDDFIEATMKANEVVTAHDPYHGRVDGPVRANNIAVCQPGPGVMAGTALMSEAGRADKPMSLTVIASPIDVSQNPTSTNEYAQTHPIEWFRNSVLFPVHGQHAGAGRMAYPGHLQRLAFVFKNAESAQNHRQRMIKFHSDLLTGNTDSVQKKVAFDQVFLFDIASMYAELYDPTVEQIFQQNNFGKGRYDFRGAHRVDTRYIDIPVIAAEGTKDDVCGLGQTSALLDLASGVASKDKAHGVFDAGHYMFAGGAFRNDVGPWLFEKIRGFDEQLEFSPLAAESRGLSENIAIAHTPEAA